MPPLKAAPHAAALRRELAHGHDHDHSAHDGHGGSHSYSHVHAHSGGHHSHGPGQRHPAARPAASLLRLSAWQRLAIVLPLAGLLWAATLLVIAG